MTSSTTRAVAPDAVAVAVAVGVLAGAVVALGVLAGAVVAFGVLGDVGAEGVVAFGAPDGAVLRSW
ncbi:hypothetical protein ABZ920_28070 [Streptomyces sp. NPDC046831]|uniref:hypothetical protein n=1 Tax=Streptomyces sp. NPDC046831 TaxID=3154805 RepID=UPI0033CF463A